MDKRPPVVQTEYEVDLGRLVEELDAIPVMGHGTVLVRMSLHELRALVSLRQLVARMARE